MLANLSKRTVKIRETILILFGAWECGQRSTFADFSLHLFLQANGKKGFHTCRPPKPLIILINYSEACPYLCFSNGTTLRPKIWPDPCPFKLPGRLDIKIYYLARAALKVLSNGKEGGV